VDSIKTHLSSDPSSKFSFHPQLYGIPIRSALVFNFEIALHPEEKKNKDNQQLYGTTSSCL